jgi:hypothetical protein
MRRLDVTAKLRGREANGMAEAIAGGIRTISIGLVPREFPDLLAIILVGVGGGLQFISLWLTFVLIPCARQLSAT